MGWFDGDSVVSSRSKRHSSHRSHRSHSHSHSHSKHRKRSRSSSSSSSSSGHGGRNRKTQSVVSFLAGAPLGEAAKAGSHYHRHNSSKGSFFGLGNSSSRSFFGLGRSSSYYKRSSRPNLLQRAWKKLKRLLRDLHHYAKRHPWKVFMLVIMPLITTGALAGLLAKFGLRLPRSFERMLGMAAKAGSGDSIGLVSEAVRMAGDMGSGGGRATKYESSSREYGGRAGGGYSRRTDVEADWGGGWGVGDGLKYVGKMFS